MPDQNERHRRRAIPAGAMTRVKTRRTPTIWLASVTETASTAMNAMDIPVSERPRASASRGCVLAKRSRREKIASAARLNSDSTTISDDLAVGNAEDIAEENGLGLPAYPE